jgi:hypothetical protein
VAALGVSALLLVATGPAGADPVDPNNATPPASAAISPSSTPGPTTSVPAPASSTTDPTTADPTTADPTTDPTSTPAVNPAVTNPPVVAAAVGITVTPSIDLVNLQNVTVAGTGFGANQQVGFAACKNPSTGADNCDTNHVGFATTDGTGAFNTTFTVHRILHTNNGDLDCASAPAACKIAVGELSDQSINGSTPLSFDPSVPLPPPPVLQVFPDTGLTDGQSVLALGTGYVPSSPISAFECIVASSQCVYIGGAGATVNGNGAFLATIVVRRQIVLAPWTAKDCADAPGDCELRVTSTLDFDATAAVPVDFDGSVPLPSGTVTINPDTGLTAFQTVTVSGAGFVVGGAGQPLVELGVCKTGSVDSQDCSNSTATALVDATGAFTTQLPLRRIVNFPSGAFDCGSAPDACEVRAMSFGPTAVFGSASFSFTPGPPPPPAAITVTPNTGLASGDEVTVAGTGFAPNSDVIANQCPTGGAPFCPYSSGSFTTTDASGAFSTSLRLTRGVLEGYSPPAITDCAASSGACSVFAYSFDQGDQAEAPLDFDGSVPIGAPSVAVTPGTLDLPDRALLSVDATGFTPDETVFVLECPASAPYVFCTQESQNSVLADSTGAVHVDLRVHRTLGYGSFGGAPTDCAAAVGTCVIRVSSGSEPLRTTDVPLGFDPTAVAPPPTLTVSPAGPWTDGQQVTVTGSGFTPGASLGLAECTAAGEPTASRCGKSLFDEFTADGDGNFSRSLTVTAAIETFHAGTIDCTTVAGGCVIFAANRADYGAERNSVPIVFAPSALPPDTTVAGALAFTGGGDRRLLWGGLGAVLAGAVLLVVTRRRRTA